MRCDHKRIVARMNCEIVNGNFRQIVFKTRPLLSTVKRDEQSKFSSCEKQIRIFQIFTDDKNMTFNFICRYRCPGFTEVSGLINI